MRKSGLTSGTMDHLRRLAAGSDPGTRRAWEYKEPDADNDIFQTVLNEERSDPLEQGGGKLLKDTLRDMRKGPGIVPGKSPKRPKGLSPDFMSKDLKPRMSKISSEDLAGNVLKEVVKDLLKDIVGECLEDVLEDALEGVLRDIVVDVLNDRTTDLPENLVEDVSRDPITIHPKDVVEDLPTDPTDSDWKLKESRRYLSFLKQAYDIRNFYVEGSGGPQVPVSISVSLNLPMSGSEKNVSDLKNYVSDVVSQALSLGGEHHLAILVQNEVAPSMGGETPPPVSVSLEGFDPDKESDLRTLIEGLVVEAVSQFADSKDGVTV